MDTPAAIIGNSCGYVALNRYTDNDEDDTDYRDPADMFGRRGACPIPDIPNIGGDSGSKEDFR